MGYETVKGKKVKIWGRTGHKTYSYGKAKAQVEYAPQKKRYYIELETARTRMTAQSTMYKTKNAAIKAAKRLVADRG